MQRGFVRVFRIFSFMFNSHLAILAHSYLDVGRCHFAGYQDMETDAVTLPGNGVGLHGLVDLRRPAVHATFGLCVNKYRPHFFYHPIHNNYITYITILIFKYI